MSGGQEQISVRETFDMVAGGYDNDSLRFFQESARTMTGYFNKKESLRLLDVATGTGNLALELAVNLPGAEVTGIDFSTGMLAQARAKANARNITNLNFAEMDMQAMEFANGHFDAAVCAFGIFFVDDMEGLLKHISDKVRSGGSVLISNFYENAFSPCVDLFLDRLEKYGVERPPLRWKRIASESACISIFRQAGLNDVRVARRDLGYFLNGADKWWDVVWNGGFRSLVEQLPQNDLARFREEHLCEIKDLRTADGIRLNVDVLFTVGRK